MAQKQKQDDWSTSIWFLSDEQEMDNGGGVHHAYVDLSAGPAELIYYFFCRNYILTLQTGLVATEVIFEEVEEEAKLEPLRMEHFYFPLGLWLVGILLSVFSFLAEIIIHRLGKSKTDIPNTRLEEPGVTQSTPGSEDGHNSNAEDTKG